MASDVKSLTKEFSTPARKLISSSDGRIIVDVSPLDRKAHFPRIEVLRFQHFFKAYFPKILDGTLTADEAIAGACTDANVSQDFINRHLKSKSYKQWVADRMAELEASEGITPAYIAMKHKLNIEGEIKLSMSQQSSLGELGDRIWPKVQKIEQTVTEKQSYSMDDLKKAKDEVDDLEKRLMIAQAAELKKEANPGE